jgi:hypothetical protein
MESLSVSLSLYTEYSEVLDREVRLVRLPEVLGIVRYRLWDMFRLQKRIDHVMFHKHCKLLK